MFGYAGEEYARSLTGIGEPLALTKSGGWILTRALHGENVRDATGCYPLFSCIDWNSLGDDLHNLSQDIIAVSLVADPAADVTTASLQQAFPDVCYHFKNHFFADLSRPLTSFVSDHHQRNAKRSSKALRIEMLHNPVEHLTNWIELYDQLVDRHQINGQAAFSRYSFERQLQVPGIRAYAAWKGTEMVGMILWMVTPEIAYYHLAAYSDVGYETKASFALFWHCLEVFATEGKLQAAFGGGAGTFASSDGLNRFKSGWSSEVRPAYLCGRILNRQRYLEIVKRSGQIASSYFPAYRTPPVLHAA